MKSGLWTQLLKILQKTLSEYLIRESSTGRCFNHFRNHPKVYTEPHPFRGLEKVQIHQPMEVNLEIMRYCV